MTTKTAINVYYLVRVEPDPNAAGKTRTVDLGKFFTSSVASAHAKAYPGALIEKRKEYQEDQHAAHLAPGADGLALKFEPATP